MTYTTKIDILSLMQLDEQTIDNLTLDAKNEMELKLQRILGVNTNIEDFNLSFNFFVEVTAKKKSTPVRRRI